VWRVKGQSRVCFEENLDVFVEVENNETLFVSQRLRKCVCLYSLKRFEEIVMKMFSYGDSWLWHRRLGHAHMEAISKLSRKRFSHWTSQNQI